MNFDAVGLSCRKVCKQACRHAAALSMTRVTACAFGSVQVMARIEPRLQMENASPLTDPAAVEQQSSDRRRDCSTDRMDS